MLGSMPTVKLHPSVRPDMYRRRLRNGWPKDRAASEPANSRRPCATITLNGVRLSLVEALRQSGVGLWTYHSRRRLGWSEAHAATTPPRRGRPNAKTEPLYAYRGKEMSLHAWSKKLGINYRTLLQRIRRGLSFSEAIAHRYRGRLPESE